jgi:hypothetical protein
MLASRRRVAGIEHRYDSGMTDEPLTASQRFFMAIGKPVPPPLTEEERREFEAKIAAAEEEAAKFYKIGRYAE